MARPNHPWSTGNGSGEARPVPIRINGADVVVLGRPGETLLQTLRDDLGLTGAKEGCDKGTCGACTVLIDDRPVLACLTLTQRCEDRSVRTVEGLRTSAGLHRLQTAFARFGAAQCGFCTPGMLMSAVAFVEGRAPAAAPPSRDEVAHALAGNLCRCTGYVKILDAVRWAAGAELDP